jgi:hypothetical protein
VPRAAVRTGFSRRLGIWFAGPMSVQISPSILAADFARLADEA